jgi:hypothetical protein
MEIIRLTWLFSVLALTACHSAGQPNANLQNNVPTEWRFNFFTPQVLPAVVTFAVIQELTGRFIDLILSTVRRLCMALSVSGTTAHARSTGTGITLSAPLSIFFFAGTL